MDLADDRFDVTYDPATTNAERMLRAIRDLDLYPVVVASPEPGNAEPTPAIDRTKLPADLAALFGRAERLQRSVLLQFSGPG